MISSVRVYVRVCIYLIFIFWVDTCINPAAVHLKGILRCALIGINPIVTCGLQPVLLQITEAKLSMHFTYLQQS